MDVTGQEKRTLKRERICPVIGPGSLGASARERRAREIVQQSGADTVEHFERVVARTGVTFGEQADTWYAIMSNPRRVGQERSAHRTIHSRFVERNRRAPESGTR